MNKGSQIRKKEIKRQRKKIKRKKERKKMKGLKIGGKKHVQTKDLKLEMRFKKTLKERKKE